MDAPLAFVHVYKKTDNIHLQTLLHLAPWSMVLNEPSIDNTYKAWVNFMAAIEIECVPQTRSHRKFRSFGLVQRSLVSQGANESSL